MAADDEQQHSGPAPGDYPSDNDNVEGYADTTSGSSPLTIAVKSRKGEYTRHLSLHVKVGTWNVASISGTEKDVGKWFVQQQGVCGRGSASQNGSGSKPVSSGGDEVGLYVLGLQEIVDVSSPTEALRPYTDPAPANRWKRAVEDALPPGYKLIAETQLIGLLQLIYAAPSIADSISAVSSTSVGTGLLGYMGNKGAVATRLLLGETTCIVFVNCHLAAGSDKTSLDRRNWDASQIIGRTRFDPVDLDFSLRDIPSESIGDEDYCFWFGDLNYRLEDIPGDDVRQVLARHTENEYDKRHGALREVHGTPSSPRIVVGKDQGRQSPVSEQLSSGTESPGTDEDLEPHEDPASLQTTISSLFPHDQLRMQQSKQKAFHEGWREGQISFLPTYKYDIGSVARFDSSEKHRGPSWCDRILYRSRKDKLNYENLAKEATEARKRDEEMKASGLESAAADDSVLFDYDPEADGADSGDEYDPDDDQGDEQANPESSPEKDSAIRLDYYNSHQGVLSSDHKPLVAGFTLELDCVEPKLKAQVHQEVVRELDKAENESRPGLTVVVDSHTREPSKGDTDPNAVDFGDVCFDIPVHQSLTVANTSGVSATFSVQKPERGGDADAPSWLEFRVETSHHDDSDHKEQASPDDCTLLPGDLAVVDITVWVRDIKLVRLLNSGQLKLEEILVLRVKDGRDHFISAHGKWLPTAFGRSLEELTFIPETGARSLAAHSPESTKRQSGVPISAPRELFKLTEAISDLAERAVAEWGMVKGDSESNDTAPWQKEPHGSAWPFEPETWTLKDKEERSPLLASAREAIDTKQSFSQVFAPEVSSLHRLEILGEVLVAFLRSLKDGIISASVWQTLDQQIQAREKAKKPLLSWEDSQAWILESLAWSPAHSVSFTFVTFMLARIANEIVPIPPRGSTKPASNENTKPSTNEVKDDQSSTSSPISRASFISTGSFRRKPTFSTPPTPQETTVKTMTQRRLAVEGSMASFFSGVLISSDVPVPSKDKEKRQLEERKRSIIEPFIKTIGVDYNGPSGGAP
ncbi:phosphatase family protein [Aspergillus stella-maris]|uniref:phosphatase family protein n=1 Tax=Aspergillus stella-maris TaxID=1810926 RepID=UPI003CCD8620